MGRRFEPVGAYPYSAFDAYNLVGVVTLCADWRFDEEELADTGAGEVPVIPLTLGLFAVGVYARTRRKRA